MSQYVSDSDLGIFSRYNPIATLNSNIIIIEKEIGDITTYIGYLYYLHIVDLDIKVLVRGKNRTRLFQYIIDNNLIHLCQNTNIRDDV